MQSNTEGASIAYTTDADDNPTWKLYSAPIPLESDTITVRAKAIRIGYAESAEVKATFNVNNQS